MESILNEIIKDKKALEEEDALRKEEVEKLKADYCKFLQEKSQHDNEINSLKSQVENYKYLKKKIEANISLIKIERDNLKISNDDLIKKTIELSNKISSLEYKNKAFSDSIDNEAELHNTKWKSLSENMRNEIISLEKKLNRTKEDLDEFKSKCVLLEKKNKNLTEVNTSQANLIEKLKNEFKEKENLIHKRGVELIQINTELDQFKKLNSTLLLKLNKNDEEWIHKKQKLFDNENEINALKCEIERLEKINSEFKSDLNDCNTAKLNIIKEFENFRIKSVCNYYR